jgi:hypothetical protein
MDCFAFQNNPFSFFILFEGVDAPFFSRLTHLLFDAFLPHKSSAPPSHQKIN